MKFVKALEHNGELYKIGDTICAAFDTGIFIAVKTIFVSIDTIKIAHDTMKTCEEINKKLDHIKTMHKNI